MAYVDGFVIPVPKDRLDAYKDFARRCDKIWREHGAIARGCRVFDFTIGDERYKSEWSDQTLLLFDHRSAATVVGWLVAWPQTLIAAAKRFIKQTPVLNAWATVLRPAA